MSLPTAIDRYQIRERLGQGGMGTLFLALDPAIDRLVALKVLRVDNPDIRERFEREARLAARLQHPNIVTVYDVGEHEGQPFIAMEYIPGDTLQDYIRRRDPLDPRRKVEIMIDVCAGLAYAHKHGIVHRDVKPANLIVSRESQIVKILDFGIARAGESGLTQVGMVIGTPNYMSPEQVRGELVDHRSDIFAVGLVLYELLVYRRAFDADTQTAVLLKILNEAPPTLLSLDSGLDPALVEIVERTLAKDPAERPPDLGSLRSELTRLLYRLESISPDERTMIVPRPNPRTGAGGMTGAGRPPTPSPSDPQQPRRTPATLLGQARLALAAGAVTEANALLQEAVKLDPHAADVPALRQLIERALADRERNQDRARRAASALAQAHQSLESGALDSAARAVGEALSLTPDEPAALALRAEIQRRRARGAPSPPVASQSVGPPPVPSPPVAPPPVPPPPSFAPPPPPPPTPLPTAVEPPQGGRAGRSASGVPATRHVPLAFLGAAAVVLFLVALVAVMMWRQFSTRASSRTASPPQTTSPTPLPLPQKPAQTTPSPAPPVANATPPAAPARPGTEGAAPDPNALITARLAEADRLFNENLTQAALDDLGELFDEAPQREDVRETAERWARALQFRAQRARASVPKPTRGPWPTPMRTANQMVRTAELQLQNGELLASARSFERARAEWDRLGELAARRRAGARRGAETVREETPAERVTVPNEPRPAAPAPAPEPPPNPAPAETGPNARPAEPATDQDLVRAAIDRTLAAFERAYESRSAASLRPIWPSLSNGAIQSYQAQFSRVLFQQWTYNSRDIRVGPNGNRAVAQCSVTVSVLEPGSRDTRVEQRTVRFELERLGPLWVIASVSGV